MKEAAVKYNYISPEEYLDRERNSSEKHEYFDGEVFAMAGATPAHNDIAFNINKLIAPFLKRKRCKLYGSDFRVNVPKNKFYTYPDFSIVCGAIQTTGVYADNLTNPSVIIEILSAGSNNYDRGTKFSLYRGIDSLKEYILIDSASVYAEIHVRESTDQWTLTILDDLSNSFTISSIGLSLCLLDLYDDIPGLTGMLEEAALKYNFTSKEEYLEKERASHEKHEYYNGEIFAMAGASWQHNIIARNINTHVLPFLKGKPCDLFGSDLRIHIPQNTLYTYPDFSIICKDPLFEDPEEDTVLNPVVIIEILSRSTMDYDRGIKFSLYREIRTLKEYILIDSTKRTAEIYTRQPNNRWTLHCFHQPKSVLPIESIKFNLPLSAIYEDVRFSK